MFGGLNRGLFENFTVKRSNLTGSIHDSQNGLSQKKKKKKHWVRLSTLNIAPGYCGNSDQSRSIAKVGLPDTLATTSQRDRPIADRLSMFSLHGKPIAKLQAWP